MSVLEKRSTLRAIDLPHAGRWTIDPSHTTVGFWARHLGVAKVRGEFRSFSGTATIAERPEDSSVEVTIEAASIDTREADRDAHLRSEDFLDVERHPALTFRSTRVSGEGARWKVDGELTIRGTTRPVVLEVEFGGVIADDGEGLTRAAFSARTDFDRTDFGLTWNQIVETGALLVGKQVHVELEVELIAAG